MSWTSGGGATIARRAPWIVPVLLVGALLAGRSVRAQLPFDPDVASVQAWVATLGWRGPALFFALFIFRQFLFLPAALLLPVAGLCFGATPGALLSTIAIVVSGLMKFGIARAVRRGWTFKVPAQIEAVGSMMVGLATAHPLGPLSWSHWVAGLSSIPLGAFVLALALGAPVRAFAWSYLGASLGEGDGMSLPSALGLLVIAALPLLHPRVRRGLGFPG